ncbi:MAG: hypothetical protein WCT07_04000 [Candidatus Paceibacterota bacterium]
MKVIVLRDKQNKEIYFVIHSKFEFEFYSQNGLDIHITVNQNNKTALCVGGAVYGYYNDDVLSETVIKIIEDQDECK